MGKKARGSLKSGVVGANKADHTFEPDEFDPVGSRADKARRARRDRFARAAASQQKSGLNILYIVLPAFLVVVIGAALLLQNQSSSTASAAKAIREVFIQPSVDGERISIPVDDVRNNKLVAFDYNSGTKTIPLTAWVTPSGAIKTAIRMCEPCNSTSFRIEGNILVCNTCGTRWDLETLKGISGGCVNYPPDPMPSIIEGGNVIIDAGPVKAWKPRA